MRLGGKLVPDRAIRDLSIYRILLRERILDKEHDPQNPNKIAASLFGYVNKAVIMDLTIQNADITGYCAVSAIAGAISHREADKIQPLSRDAR